MTEKVNGIGNVHCRIGSLESTEVTNQIANGVHCRIGSLEIDQHTHLFYHHVHCRIGSLEKSVWGGTT